MDALVTDSLAGFPTLGVICPQVPLLLSLLLPILLGALGALFMALPRLVLTFGHILYYRALPLSLIDRPIPGVRGRGFQGVTRSGFSDHYSFDAAAAPEDLRRVIVAFYERRGARLESGGAQLVFSRGNRFCSDFLAHVLYCSETRFPQRITVNLRPAPGGGAEVRVDYAVRAICMLRITPFGGLPAEMRALRQQVA